MDMASKIYILHACWEVRGSRSLVIVLVIVLVIALVIVLFVVSSGSVRLTLRSRRGCNTYHCVGAVLCLHF